MFAKRVVSDLTGKKMKKLLNKIMKSEEKLQTQSYKRRRDSDIFEEFKLDFSPPREVEKRKKGLKCKPCSLAAPRGSKLTVA